MCCRALRLFAEPGLPPKLIQLALLLVPLAMLGCGARPLLPTLSVHAVLTLRQSAIDAEQTGKHDFGVQAQLAFRPRGRARAEQPPLPGQVPIALPRSPDCQYALACEWAQLAEESTLTALGVGP
ncbi:MAG TPA: hypothetical protein VMF89_15595 [Polyangiales bacterium]|nr:hypothetical protein [Polyangiales bacterium]